MGVRSIMEYVGYNPKEIRLYISALESGESTASELAEKADVPLTTAQEVLRRMHKHGLANSYVRGHRRYWVAERPEKVLARMEEKHKAFESIIPKLSRRRVQQGNTMRVNTYTGAEEVRLIMDDMLEAKHDIWALLSWDRWVDFLGPEFIADFIERRRKRFLRLKLITDRTEAALELKKKDSSHLRLTKFLTDEGSVKSITFIYDDKVALVSIEDKKPVGIVIRDTAISETMRMLYKALWQNAE